jgi:recombination protein RecT
MTEKKITSVDEVCMGLAAAEQTFKMSLPPQIPSAKFIRVAQTAIRNNPGLAELDRNSLYAAFHKCAADGLIPDGREAVITPRKGKAVYMPMVGGICKRARNSGEIKTINALLVFENDEYDHWIDEQGEHFKHRPTREEQGKQILTYAFCQTKDGGLFFEEIDMKQMAAIEKQAQENGSAWQGPFKTEMMRKSALRRLLKYRVPSSTDIDDLIRVDDEPLPVPEPPKKAETTSSRLRDVVTTTAEPTKAEEDQEVAVAAGEDIPL